jgi:hypothetical protein
VIAPLTIERRVVGALKVFRLDGPAPPRDLVEGMAGILSLHLELAELDRERQLAQNAVFEEPVRAPRPPTLELSPRGRRVLVVVIALLVPVIKMSTTV